MVKVGLVTVLFNSDDVLEGFFKSLSIQTFIDYHLYIVDNTPSVKTDELIEKLSKIYSFSAFTHIKNESNVGVAKGNNQGIKLSLNDNTTYTLLLNNDIEFHDPELFSKLWEHAIANKESLIIPKILFFDTHKIWMAGGEFVLYKGITRHVGEGEEDNGLYSSEKYFKYAPTCFMLIENTVFGNIGLMDEKYFVYFDDTDFLYRAHLNGYKVKYLPQLCVLHKVSSSTGGNESAFSIYYSNRNRLYFIRKNFKAIRKLVAISVTLVTRIVKYINYGPYERKKLYSAVTDGLNMKYK